MDNECMVFEEQGTCVGYVAGSSGETVVETEGLAERLKKRALDSCTKTCSTTVGLENCARDGNEDCCQCAAGTLESMDMPDRWQKCMSDACPGIGWDGGYAMDGFALWGDYMRRGLDCFGHGTLQHEERCLPYMAGKNDGSEYKLVEWPACLNSCLTLEHCDTEDLCCQCGLVASTRQAQTNIRKRWEAAQTTDFFECALMSCASGATDFIEYRRKEIFRSVTAGFMAQCNKLMDENWCKVDRNKWVQGSRFSDSDLPPKASTSSSATPSNPASTSIAPVSDNTEEEEEEANDIPTDEELKEMTDGIEADIKAKQEKDNQIFLTKVIAIPVILGILLISGIVFLVIWRKRSKMRRVEEAVEAKQEKGEIEKFNEKPGGVI